jgi:hypothetical protein
MGGGGGNQQRDRQRARTIGKLADRGLTRAARNGVPTDNLIDAATQQAPSPIFKLTISQNSQRDINILDSWILKPMFSNVKVTFPVGKSSFSECKKSQFWNTKPTLSGHKNQRFRNVKATFSVRKNQRFRDRNQRFRNVKSI